MKKLLLAACALVAMVATTNAQEIFAKRDLVGHVGIGIGSYLGGSNLNTAVPPILLSGEYGILDAFINGKAAIGVGGYLAYTANKFKNSDPVTRCSYFIIGARGLFHYQFVDKLDTYAGLMLGYKAVSVKNSNPLYDSAASSFRPTLFIGARYYFSDRLAAFAELGYGIAALELGLAIRL